MTSSTKPEVRNVSQRRQRRIEPQTQQATCTENSAKFGTDPHRYRQIKTRFGVLVESFVARTKLLFVEPGSGALPGQKCGVDTHSECVECEPTTGLGAEPPAGSGAEPP